MKKIKYLYLPPPSNSNQGYPILEIEIATPDGGSVGYNCLVDSGADYCIFESDAADSMGLNWKSGIETHPEGIKSGATLTVYLNDIVYKVDGVEYEATVAFTDELDMPFGILGRDGFFNHFSVIFDEKNEEFGIESYV